MAPGGGESMAVAPGAAVGPWRLGAQLGAGAFSRVFACEFEAARSGVAGARELAEVGARSWVLKVAEPAPRGGGKARKLDGAALLFQEYQIYRRFKESGRAFPFVPATPTPVKWRYEGSPVAFLAIERLNGGLEPAVRGSADAARAVLSAGAQAVLALHDLHCIDYVFRDLKPENVMVGRGAGADRGRLFLLDFGAAYKHMKAGGLLNETPVGPAGTPKFMSRHIHQGAPPSPRDDLESLGYLLVWLAAGALPWERAGSEAEVLRSKAAASPRALCAALPAPAKAPLEAFLVAVWGMQLHDRPDYAALAGLFFDALKIARGDVDALLALGLLERTAKPASKPLRKPNVPSPAREEEEEDEGEEDLPVPTVARRNKRKAPAQPAGPVVDRSSSTSSSKSKSSKLSKRGISGGDDDNDAVQVVSPPKRRARRAAPAAATPEAGATPAAHRASGSKDAAEVASSGRRRPAAVSTAATSPEGPARSPAASPQAHTAEGEAPQRVSSRRRLAPSRLSRS